MPLVFQYLLSVVLDIGRLNGYLKKLKADTQECCSVTLDQDESCVIAGLQEFGV